MQTQVLKGAPNSWSLGFILRGFHSSVSIRCPGSWGRPWGPVWALKGHCAPSGVPGAHLRPQRGMMIKYDYFNPRSQEKT